jgi:hypothetical protein
VLATVGGLLAVLLFLLIPPWLAARRMARGIMCINNHKNTGLAFRILATDQDSRWPMNVPVPSGGSLDLTRNPDLLWRHYLVLSNELKSPKWLVCPRDPNKQPAGVFVQDPLHRNLVVLAGNQHVSYFFGLQADVSASATDFRPVAIFGGDRNLMADGQSAPAGKFTIAGGQTPGFKAKRFHRGYGHLLLAKGRVQEPWGNRLSLAASVTNLLLVPWNLEFRVCGT